MTQPYYQDECECGCAEKAAPGRRYITGHNLRTLERTDAHRKAISEACRIAWETKRDRMPLGSRRKDSNGYWLVKVREGGGRWDKEHVLVAEEHIGRRLSADEHVHHINGTKTDNRIENLHVCTRSEHALAHGSLAALLPELVGRGLVGFDPETGRYFLV